MALPLLAFLGLGAAGKLGYDRYEEAKDKRMAQTYGQLFSDAIGSPPQSLNQGQGPLQQGAPGMSQGTGLLGANPGLMGGNPAAMQFAGQMAKIPGYQVGAQALIRDQLMPRQGRNPMIQEFGVGNGKFQHHMMTPSGKWQPIDTPYEKGATTEVNIGTESINRGTPLSQKELDTYNAPRGSYWNKSGDIKFPPAAQAKEESQEERALGVVSQYEDMLFGENGIYKDYGIGEEAKSYIPDFFDNTADKLAQTYKGNVGIFSADDPRYNVYESFREATLSPLVKSLGEVGALAEGDVERAKGFQAQITGLNVDTPKSARLKLDNLKSLITKGKQNEADGIVVRIENGVRYEYKRNDKSPTGWDRRLAKPEDYADE